MYMDEYSTEVRGKKEAGQAGAACLVVWKVRTQPPGAVTIRRVQCTAERAMLPPTEHRLVSSCVEAHLERSIQ